MLNELFVKCFSSHSNMIPDNVPIFRVKLDSRKVWSEVDEIQRRRLMCILIMIYIEVSYNLYINIFESLMCVTRTKSQWLFAVFGLEVRFSFRRRCVWPELRAVQLREAESLS